MANEVAPDSNTCMYKTFIYLCQPLSQSAPVLAQVPAFCHTLSKPSFCYIRAVCGDLVTLCSKYNAVGSYYFSAWLIFGVVFVAMKYLAPHSAVPYRVTLREYENVEANEE
jgi:heme exporter protein D